MLLGKGLQHHRGGTPSVAVDDDDWAFFAGLG
jgi:hypothetical protein